MKKKIFPIIVFSIIIILVSLSYILSMRYMGVEDEGLVLSKMSMREYSKKELQFIEEYDNFIQIQDWSGSQKIITDNISVDGHVNSDFAIISLENSVYGSAAFAFLPIDSRELTDEEMHELACAFNGNDGEKVVRDYCSYKYSISKDFGIDSNRGFTSREAFLFQIKVASDYFTEGKLPKNHLFKSNESQVLCFTTCNNQEVWIYPVREMTEDELLQMLNYKYGDINKDFYTPKVWQLSADDAKVQAKELLLKHVPAAGRIDEIYVLYSANEPTPNSKTDCWKAYIHMKNSDHDYYVKFTADTGELVELVQGEKDCYTEEHYLEAKMNGEFEVIAE